MLEHAVYSVISPEAGASILWRTADKAQEMAEAMNTTAQDLLSLKVIDRLVPEPVGGAHRAPAATAAVLSAAICAELDARSGKSAAQLQTDRAQRFLRIGEGT